MLHPSVLQQSQSRYGLAIGNIGNICEMSTQKPHPILRGKRIYFRSHPRTRAALRRVVANLQASE